MFIVVLVVGVLILLALRVRNYLIEDDVASHFEKKFPPKPWPPPPPSERPKALAELKEFEQRLKTNKTSKDKA